MSTLEIFMTVLLAIAILYCVVKVIKQAKLEDECDEETPEWYTHEVEQEDSYIVLPEAGPLDFDKAYVELEQKCNDEVSDSKKIKKHRAKKTTKTAKKKNA